MTVVAKSSQHFKSWFLQLNSKILIMQAKLRSVEGNLRFMLTFARSLCIELGPKLINGILRSLLLLPRHFGENYGYLCNDGSSTANRLFFFGSAAAAAGVVVAI
jgi:hypothetical protein